MTERTAHLVDAVLPWVPVRQWVLTVPYRLRYQLAWHHGLSRAVLRVIIVSSMNPSIRYARDVRPYVLVAALVLLVEPAGAQSGGWLVQPPSSWNFPGALVPAAPEPKGDPPTDPRCAGTVRQAQTPQEQALAAAGWSLFGKTRVAGRMTVLLAGASVDGMCRPWQYQAFVFVGLRFAGTLSPTVMDSRTDGALGEIRFMSGYQLEAAFLRYADADPLCCPSRVSAVRYRIELPATLPRVVPMSVWSRSTRSN